MSNLTQKTVTKVPKITAIPESIALPGSKSQAELLRQECLTFTRYLVGQLPDSYVLARYRDAHRLAPEFSAAKPGWFDTLLLRLARLHPVLAKVADSYAAIFYKDSLLSKKLVLLAAILESSAAAYHQFDAPPARHPLLVLARLTRHVLEFGLALLLGAPLLLPLQLVAGKAPAGGHHG